MSKKLKLLPFRGVVSVGVVSLEMALGVDNPHCEEAFTYQKPKDQPHSLDLNHDYFIIVEDSNTEFDVRANLMREVAEKLAEKTDKSEEVKKAPMVCVLIEGGTRAIKAFSSSLHAAIPCIIISGTGRAADFLAKAKTLYDRDPNLQPNKMKKMLSDFLETEKVDDEIEETYQQFAEALECLKKNKKKLDNYMRVCQIDSVELDKNILELLYLQKQNQPTKVEQVLDLSFSWDRADIFGKIIRQDRQVLFFPILFRK